MNAPRALALAAVFTATALAAEEPSAPARGPRLKYRSDGPVCMCGKGLSEREIQEAMQRRQASESNDQGPLTPAGATAEPKPERGEE